MTFVFGGAALMDRCRELRQTATVYDAAYIAVAEILAAPLLSADARLSRAPGLRCRVSHHACCTAGTVAGVS